MEQNNSKRYFVSIEDLFIVDDENINSKEEAEKYVLERLGTDPYIAYDAKVVDTE